MVFSVKGMSGEEKKIGFLGSASVSSPRRTEVGESVNIPTEDGCYA